MSRWAHQPWWRAAIEMTAAVILVVILIYVWVGLAVVIFFSLAWLAGAL